MQKQLTHQSGYISGKMTQVIGLRYGPDIRFQYDVILPQTVEIKKELSAHKN